MGNLILNLEFEKDLDTDNPEVKFKQPFTSLPTWFNYNVGAGAGTKF